MKDSLVYTSPWIFPVSSPGIKDGAIAINSQRIIAVGPRQKIIGSFKGSKVIALNGILIPPLVNCHIHLELSHIQNVVSPDVGSSMVQWIEDLLQKRMDDYEDNRIDQAISNTLEQQFKSGVVLLADVGNTPPPKSDTSSQDHPEIYSILEMLAPTQQRTLAALNSVSEKSDTLPISPHAPYSTSAQLIVALKKRAIRKDHIFSIHLAESIDEIELICKSRGVFKDFLKKKGSWEKTMLGNGEYSGAVDYLDSLGVLDKRTLCVHCIHVNKDEIVTIAEKGVRVCLCPGSNQFLKVGRAPLEEMLAHNILPAIGTDSTASNLSLDMWREMQILRHQYPTVEPHIILKMATLGGARALHKDNVYGTLEKGKKPLFLEIYLDDATHLTEPKIVDALTQGGRPSTINWVTSFRN